MIDQSSVWNLCCAARGYYDQAGTILTTCNDGSYCCGYENNECCSEGAGIKINKKGQIVAKGQITSSIAAATSSNTPTPTSSSTDSQRTSSSSSSSSSATGTQTAASPPQLLPLPAASAPAPKPASQSAAWPVPPSSLAFSTSSTAKGASHEPCRAPPITPTLRHT
ncbi:MAG: hypothetical protein Q9228_007219 [Teloschistes exilis]